MKYRDYDTTVVWLSRIETLLDRCDNSAKVVRAKSILDYLQINTPLLSHRLGDVISKICNSRREYAELEMDRARLISNIDKDINELANLVRAESGKCPSMKKPGAAFSLAPPSVAQQSQILQLNRNQQDEMDTTTLDYYIGYVVQTEWLKGDVSKGVIAWVCYSDNRYIIDKYWDIHKFGSKNKLNEKLEEDLNKRFGILDALASENNIKIASYTINAVDNVKEFSRLAQKLPNQA